MINRIKDFIHPYKSLLKRVLFVGFMPSIVFFFFFMFFSVLGANLIEIIRDFFFSFYISSTKVVLSLLGYSLVESINNNIFQIIGKDIVVTNSSMISLIYFLITPLVLSVFIENRKKIVILWLVFYVFIILSAIALFVLRVVNPEIFNSNNVYSLYFNILMTISILVLPFIRIIKAEFNKRVGNNQSDSILDKLDKEFRFSFIFFLGLFAFLYLYQIRPFRSIAELSFIDRNLTDLILYATSVFLKILNYNPEIYGTIIYGDNSGVDLQAGCLGKNIMFVFIFVMMLFRGKVLPKILWIALGLSVIIVMNIIRISYIYIFVAKHGDINYGWINIHDLFNYPVYIAILVLWWLYLKFIQTKLSSCL